MLRIFKKDLPTGTPDIRIAAQFIDTDVFAPFRTSEIKKNKRTIICVCNDIQAYFNAQRLSQFGSGVQDALLKIAKQSISPTGEQYSDEVLMGAIRDKYCQSNSDIRSFVNFSHQRYEDFKNDILLRAKQAEELRKANEELQKTD